MRKRFPAPKGLGSRSYADRYAAARTHKSSKGFSNKEALKRFLPCNKPLDLSGNSIKTSRTGWGLLLGIFVVSLILGTIILSLG